MVTYRADHRFAKPVPVHALEPGSVAAVERMRAMGRERALERAVRSLVVSHGQVLPREKVIEVDPVTRNARALLALAERAGFTAQMLVVGSACIVEGYRLAEKVGFRARWVGGGADGFSWHTPWAYEMTADLRPVARDSRTFTGKKGYRSPGMGAHRLSLVGTPWGVKVTWAELQRRVRAFQVVTS